MRTVYYDMTTVARWQGHPTGIARVVDKIARELINIDGLNIKFVTFKDNNWFYLYDIKSQEENALVDFKKSDLFCSLGSNWDFQGYNKALLDVKAKGVYISILFHDTIPVLFPYLFGEGFAKIYDQWLVESLEMIDFGFTNSNSTKKDILNFININNLEEKNFKFIRLGDEINRRKAEIKDVKAKIKALNNYILSVGSIEYRKNHITLLNAYRYLVTEGRQDLPILVIVGREGFLNNELVFQIKNDLILKDRVKIFSDISDNDLDYLYRNCMFTVYPALYEGWGLPIAESLQYGKQCIASNTSSMVEIAPTLTRFAHPLNAIEWAENINELFLNKEMLFNENKAIMENYKGTSWHQTAKEVSSYILENILYMENK